MAFALLIKVSVVISFFIAINSYISMTAVPHSAIIFVNNDLAPSTQSHLVRQLFITEVIDGATFDLGINSPDGYQDGYIDGYNQDQIKRLDQRIMVVRSFADRATVSTWALADVVMFVKQGLCAVEVNKFGPPNITIPVLKITWGFLGIH